jgi:hypothetical protein
MFLAAKLLFVVILLLIAACTYIEVAGEGGNTIQIHDAVHIGSPDVEADVEAEIEEEGNE